jgi:hypothetical protein
VPKSLGNTLPAATGAGVAAVAAFVAAASLHLPLGYLFRYARIDLFPRPFLALAALPLAVVIAFLHEGAIRGKLYGFLQERVPPGLAAPLAALAGTALPLAARLVLFPVPGVPPLLVASHAFGVEYLLSLGLTWMALGTASTRPGTYALAALWALRLSLGVRFHGGVFPLMEMGAAGAAALLVTQVLRASLAPHRDRVLGAA